MNFTSYTLIFLTRYTCDWLANRVGLKLLNASLLVMVVVVVL